MMIEAPEPFRCEVSYAEDSAAVLVYGEVDLATGPKLLREVLATVARPITSLAVDLRFATFVDSSGIATLVKSRDAADEHGIEFRLVSVPPQARTVLEITSLAETFGLAPRSGSLPPSHGGTAA